MKKKAIVSLFLTLALFAGCSGGGFDGGNEYLEAGELATEKYADLLPTTEEIFGYIEDLVKTGKDQPFGHYKGGRIPGTPGGDAAQQYLLDFFEKLGLEDVRVIPSTTRLWVAEDWGFAVDGEEIQSFPMYKSYANARQSEDHDGVGYGSNNLYVFDTGVDFGPNGLETELVYVDAPAKSSYQDLEELYEALAEEYGDDYFEDKIVVGNLSAAGYNIPFNYYLAQEWGAAGFIGILDVDCSYFSPEDMTYIAGNFEIPGLYVSSSEGDKIVDLIKAAGEENKLATANLKLRGYEKEVEAGAVVGLLPGSDPDDGSVILAHSHYDSSTPEGAVQDATGMATVMAAARFYSDIPREDRARNILFMGTDTHMSDYDSHCAVVDEYNIGGWYASVYDPEKPCNILADLCIEHIGKTAEIKDGDFVFSEKGPSIEAQVTKSKALEIIAREEVEKYHTTGMKPDGSAPSVRVIEGESMVTDADIFYGGNEGIPCVSIMGYSIPYMYHECDTLDKVAKEDLLPVQEVFSNILWRLLSLDEGLFDDRP